MKIKGYSQSLRFDKCKITTLLILMQIFPERYLIACHEIGVAQLRGLPHTPVRASVYD